MSLHLYTRDAAAGTWVERALLTDQWSITDTLNERSTARFRLSDDTGVLRFLPGHRVRLEDDSLGILFEGFVATASESRLGPGGTRTHDLDCHDLHYLLDKRIVAGAWTNTTAGAIVRSIVAGLASEGLTVGSVAAGAQVRAFTANYRSVAAVMQDLADRSGYWWRVNVDHTVDFLDMTTRFVPLTYDGDELTLDGETITINPVPFGLPLPPPSLTLGPDDALADTVAHTAAAPKFRNRQWIRGGRDTTLQQVEEFAGDGAARTFPLGFAMAKQPKVEVDRGSGWIEETVGPAGISTGKQWYFTYGSVTLTQDETGSVLAANHRVRVTYYGLYSIIARVDDHAGQADLAILEGGTGIVEHVLDDHTVTTRAAAFELGGALLAAYAEDSETLRFATERLDIRPGLLVATTFPQAPNEMLVTSVELSSRNGIPLAVVTLTVGPAEGSWAQWFLAPFHLVEAATEPLGAEVDIVTTVLNFSKTWLEAERPNIFFDAFPGSGLYPDADLVPAFQHHRRVRYMAWHQAGVEWGRKALTDSSDQAVSPIDTTVVLGATDAVGSWSHLSWWGGDMATGALGTGVRLELVPYPFTKTNVEVMNVERTDTKGW